jgi:hypothetical protein
MFDCRRCCGRCLRIVQPYEEIGTRLLLGHTMASMITGIHVFKDLLLTGDRHNKIRVSRFPESYEIDGYLRGQKVYVIYLAVALQGPNAGMVAPSCGGDSTI